MHNTTPLTPSPCIRNCCLDDADICLGCGRHMSEILAWGNADESERSAIVVRAQDRKAQRLQKRQ